ITDNGGTATAANFAMHVRRTGVTNDLAGGAGAESPGNTYTLTPGAYAVTESGGPAGYAESDSAGCTGTLAYGDHPTCTLTNNDISPQLKVVKRVVNDNGGSKLPGDFTMNVTATNPSNGSFAGVNDVSPNDGTTITLDAGAYSVAEGTHAGYAVTY